MIEFDTTELLSVFESLSGDPRFHSRLLNAFSMLEYIGARKILKSQHSDEITEELLSHAAEEIRHAYRIKKLVLKMSGGELTTYHPDHVLCCREARNYIQSLDQSAESQVGEGNSFVNYLYTTLLIEERANWIYPLYESVLAEMGYGGHFKSIIAEEKNHLEKVLQHLKADQDRHEMILFHLRKTEKMAFASFLGSVKERIKLGCPASA